MLKAVIVLAHVLLEIMLDNLLGWQHTLSLQTQRVQIAVWNLGLCLKDRFVIILSKKTAVPFIYSLDPASSGPSDSSRHQA